MINLALPVIFSFVAYVISYGILFPAELKSLQLFAVAGTLCGYYVGNVSKAWMDEQNFVIRSVISFGLMCSFVLILSIFLDEAAGTPTGFWGILFLSSMLTLSFFVLSALLALSGVSLKVDEN